MTSLNYTDAASFCTRAFAALGMPDESAIAVTEVFLRAQWKQQGHHDLSYLPQRLEWLKSGLVNATAVPEVVEDLPGLSVFDGGNCLGELGCSVIVRHAMEKAATAGISLATIRRSNHYLAGGPYAEMAAERGFLALVFSSTDKTMASPMGGEAIIGNNPLSAGVPLDDRHFVLDMCMAYSSLGTLKKNLALGTRLPDYAGFDSEGRPSGDPERILGGGSLAPLGGHKGWGLALLVELLTGGINGGAMGLDIPTGGGIGGHSQTVILINLGLLGSSSELGARFSEMLENMKIGHPGIRYPGSRRPAWKDADMQEDCGLNAAVLDQLHKWSIELGLG